MPLASLELRGFWLFDKIRLDFDPRVNVFVGPNNSGKTTVLLALAAGVGRSAFPDRFAKPEAHAKVEWYDRSPSVKQVHVYTSHGPQPPQDEPATPAERNWTMYVPALRLSTDYRSRGPGRMAGQEEEEEIWPETGESWTSDRKIIDRIIELDYRSHLKRRPAIRKTLDRIADLAGRITEGFPVEFAGVDSDNRGFFPRFRTPDGEVPLNVLSQGTQSILQWCAQLLIGYSEFYDFPESLDDKPGVLIIDEIDAHLHPSWQRRILPALTKMFPSLQIFCAAHSPMTLAGLRAGQVQLLKRDEKGRVTVSRNETDILGWSVDEIYSGFMGVEPTDLETVEKLGRLRALRHKSPKLTPEETDKLNALRADIGRDLADGPSAARVGTGAAELVRRAREAKTRKPSARVRGAK